MGSAQIGVIGLAVMGQNLARNMARNAFRVVVYNRTTARTTEFLEGPAAGSGIVGSETLEEFVAALAVPRRILIMVKSGAPVDGVIDQLLPLLDEGDIIMDGGNSYYEDTERRTTALAEQGLHFLGVGISGGEEGALHGPSIMPGGSREAYQQVEPILTAIAAKAAGEPCVTYLGPRGAGHYVKMVHNGIEYGVMQLIAEAYDLLHRGAGMDAAALHALFGAWNEGALASFLIEITADIFAVTDPESGEPLVEQILDRAGQKGTGRWTAQDALELGVPTPTINAAVVARVLSSMKEERVAAAVRLPAAAASEPPADPAVVVEAALYASTICAYAQGFAQLAAASEAYGYDLNLGEIAAIWRGGCIIRAVFLDEIRAAFQEESRPANLLLASPFQERMSERQSGWRAAAAWGAIAGIPTPATAGSLAYFDSYRSPRLPANLIQAQRDYFGAHTYRRTDREGDFHSEWGGQ